MTKHTIHRFLARFHKWVGLVLGLQLLAWTIGGVYMTWVPIEDVRSEHRIAHQTPRILDATIDPMPMPELVSLIGQDVISMKFQDLLGRLVVLVETRSSGKVIFDATTGEQISPIGADLAKAIAEADFNLDVPVVSVKSITSPVIEYRRELPVWQIVFADKEETALYVSPHEARVVARRSNTWRIFDFFWMLHIMDYDERSDFNHPLLMAFALSASIFALSGFVLFGFRFRRRDLPFLPQRRKTS